MAGTAPQIRVMTTDETRNISVDMSALLDDGEVLVGTPDVQCAADLVIDNAQINAATIDVNGSVVAVGMAVQFRASSHVAARYDVEIVCNTDAGQVIEGCVVLHVKRSRQ